ncbi:MAG: DUF2268 domain-containing putative Zn-dependent protease [Bacteroidales bacterium]|nr:DUF2268 domain-containing putative Zn-dependent protease [Bacteroidales bacterium]
MEVNPDSVAQELYLLYEDFPLFGYGADLSDKHSVQQIRDFITDSRSKELLEQVLEKYPNLNSLETALGEAFARYNQFFGKNITPTIYTYISYLDYDNRIIFEELETDTVLIIAIDMYLGEHNKHYDAVAIPMYIRLRLDEEFIPVDAMRAVAHFELEKTPHLLQTLLDHMILHGKIAYFLEQTLPKTDATIRFGYTPEQMVWTKKNEKMLWSYLVGEKLLYEQNSFKFRSFVMESPTIQAFQGSPGRVGHYLGYRIVKKYMENTGQTIPELFAETDTQKILKLSNYRP